MIKGKIGRDQLNEEILKNIDNIHFLKGVILNKDNWFETNGIYIYKYTSELISENTMVDVNVHLASLDDAQNMKSCNESFNGYLLLFSSEEITKDITCDIKICTGGF